MNEGRSDDRAPASGTEAEEEQVRRMMRLAGARPPIDVGELEALRGVALGAWRARYGHRPRAAAGRPRWLPWLAAAAAVLLVAGTIALRRSRTGAGAPGEGEAAAAGTVVAAVERIDGSATLATGDRVARGLAAGAEVRAGATLETGPGGRLALRSGGRSLRLDRGSRVRFERGDRVFVERGAIYVDSPPGGALSSLVVATASGEFREVGTQFEVRSEPSAGVAARLRVREGSVRYRSADREANAAAGEELALAADGTVRRTTVVVHGADWDWVLASAPPLAIEGIPARRFLDWVARETGLELEFADRHAEEAASAAVLHGSIAGVAVADAPAAVLPTCGLAHEIAGGRLRISVRTSS